MTTAPSNDNRSADVAPAPGGTDRRSLLLLVVMLVVVLSVPALFGRGRTPEPFDRAVVDRFGAAAPEIVFLGNSLLETRIDAGYLTDLSGLRTASLATFGSGPGIWYLQLKNVIGASADRPETVVIFFHDDLITRPVSFTGPGDRGLVERLSLGPETDYRAVAAGAENPGDRIRRGFAAVYPLAGSSLPGRGAMASAGAFLAGMNRDEVAGGVERTVPFANRREQARNIQQPKFHGAFGSTVENSYLPLLIGQASELSVELVIVRVAARPRDNGTPNEPGVLARYTSELSDYLAANGIRYIDMTGNPEIDAAMYLDGYHLKYRFRTFYTEIFSQLLLSDGGTGR